MGVAKPSEVGRLLCYDVSGQRDERMAEVEVGEESGGNALTWSGHSAQKVDTEWKGATKAFRYKFFNRRKKEVVVNLVTDQPQSCRDAGFEGTGARQDTR